MMQGDSDKAKLVKQLYNAQEYGRFEREYATAMVRLKYAIDRVPPDQRAMLANSLSFLSKSALGYLKLDPTRMRKLTQLLTPDILAQLDDKRD